MTLSSRIIEALSPHVLPRRLTRMKAILSSRVRDTVVVCENLTDEGNVSAIIRTAEALGIQHVHVINSYSSPANVKGIDKGSSRWLNVHHHENPFDCVRSLRANGFRALATDLSTGAVDMYTAVQMCLRKDPWESPHRALTPLSSSEASASSLSNTTDLEAAQPTRAFRIPSLLPPPGFSYRPRVAIVFGNEQRGVSRALAGISDLRWYIPQLGFVQSLNVSAAAAVAISTFLSRTPDFYTRYRETLCSEAVDEERTVLEESEKRTRRENYLRKAGKSEKEIREILGDRKLFRRHRHAIAEGKGGDGQGMEGDVLSHMQYGIAPKYKDFVSAIDESFTSYPVPDPEVDEYSLPVHPLPPVTLHRMHSSMAADGPVTAQGAGAGSVRLDQGYYGPEYPLYQDILAENSVRLCTEPLPLQEQTELITRWLMASVPFAANILEKKGIRPYDF